MIPKIRRFKSTNKIYLSQKHFWPQQSKINTCKVAIYDTYSMKGKSQNPLYTGISPPSRQGGGRFMSPAFGCPL